MQRSFVKRLGYKILHIFCRLCGVIFFRIRVKGRENQTAGGALICSNHQSFFDPVLVGLAFEQRMNYLARKTLFKFPPFRWLIEYLDAIPIDRDGMGLQGIKETLRRLKRSEMVLIFPEGTRTRDGHVASLKPGFVALARRGKQPLIPVGLDGAYAAWPRESALPRLSTIHICIGEPITAEQIEQWSDHEIVTELESRIRECHRLARIGREA
ncbi:MAG: 1-acyl-sn-glycerol-3-phosphate acyltransferase [Pirellulaceae bacterium]|jgi:1-acyl-sn-glycerol-3-phosphate acyltransferase